MNCIYCNPLTKDQFISQNQVLSQKEIFIILKAFVKKGIKKLRLTGGEPLIKRNLPGLIKKLKTINGLQEISITTNGLLLKNKAGVLKKAGLDRINISLDTLKKERFKKITGQNCFNDVWQGIESALKHKLDPVKLNVILMKGINDDEIIDFAYLTKTYKLHIRFIELFPTNKRTLNFMSHKMTSQEAKKIIQSRFGFLKSVSGITGNGPAQYYQLQNTRGSIGFISNLSDYFCHSCNRLRINCSGLIAPCLFSGYLYDIKPLIRKNQINGKLNNFITEIIQNKYKYKKKPGKHINIEMSSIGG